ncbi:RING/U-box superfamily protein [Euphorbia peplus]|nr:RING/U-box superfamily protein [Euphorbia peplus]
MASNSRYYRLEPMVYTPSQFLRFNTLSIPSDTETFDIHTHVTTIRQSSNYYSYSTSPESHFQFRLPRHIISSHDESIRASAIRDILHSSMPIIISRLTIEDLIPRISSLAFEIVNRPSNMNETLLCMGLAINCIYPYDEREELYRVLRESADGHLGFKAASKLCIDGLKRVRVTVGDDADMKDCMICLEKHLVGDEVIRLPCKHIFHGDCIVKWLEMSHLCPLCRFSMSVENE